VSYAVVLTRHEQRAAAALRSIAAQSPVSELLLVLNDADDAMRALAREAAATGARILHDGTDLGVALAWNLALREARSPSVCVLHEDSEMQPGCAARLLETLRERPDAGAVGPLTLNADGSVQYAGAIIWSDGATTRITNPMDADVYAVDYLASSCLVLRRDAVLGVGGFDQRMFPAMYVDASVAVGLWQTGVTVLCDCRATSVHHTAAMVDPARGPRRSNRSRQFLLTRNRGRFRAIHQGWLAGQADRADTVDAGRATPHELAEAMARVRVRERRARGAEPVVPADALTLPDDLEAAASGLRRELDDDFLAHLIEREETLVAELERVHRVHAEAAAELEVVHGVHAELHAELERVHMEYARLWEDRQRLLDARNETAAAPSADPHA
jgi:GT2 family glycosyltransferase